MILERHVPLKTIRTVDGYEKYQHHEFEDAEPTFRNLDQGPGKGSKDKQHNKDADKVIVNTLRKGQYFGEVAAMTGYKHTATVRVKGDPNIPSTEQCLIVAAMPK